MCYFLNASGYICSDCILVGDGEHWGIIDAGNRFEEKITDKDGTVYDVLFSKALSSQEYFKNGKDIAEYIVDVFGIEHLDFIMGSHAHSDHIGGMPYFAEIKAKNGQYIVDENTVYFYKRYFHVNNNSDDLMEENSDSWHCQAFEYQALKAMRSRNAKIIDLTMSDLISDSNIVQKVKDSNFESVYYDKGEGSNNYDDYLAFKMGDISIRFYNLYHTDTSLDENVNSIVTVITGNNKSVCLLGDVNTESRTEQNICEAIAGDIGTVDVLKAAHHGYLGSNTKEMVDFLQPKYVMVTRNDKWIMGEITEDYLMPQRYYAGSEYGTVYYEVGVSDKGIMLQLTDSEIKLLEVSGTNDVVEYRNADFCINRTEPNDGWARWINEIAESGEDTMLPWWYYFENGVEVTGLKQLDWAGGTDWFYFNDEGQMQTGWQEIDGHEWYFNEYTGVLEKKF